MRNVIRYIIAFGGSILLFVILPLWAIVKYVVLLFTH